MDRLYESSEQTKFKKLDLQNRLLSNECSFKPTLVAKAPPAMSKKQATKIVEYDNSKMDSIIDFIFNSDGTGGAPQPSMQTPAYGLKGIPEEQTSSGSSLGYDELRNHIAQYVTKSMQK